MNNFAILFHYYCIRIET